MIINLNNRRREVLDVANIIDVTGLIRISVFNIVADKLIPLYAFRGRLRLRRGLLSFDVDTNILVSNSQYLGSSIVTIKDLL